MAIEAAKFALSQELLPKDATSLSLERMVGAALSMKQEELRNGRPKPPVFSLPDKAASAECSTAWAAKYGALLEELRSEASLEEARAAAAPWAAAVLEAKREVIEPNRERLSEHLQNMWVENMDAAKRVLEGSRLRAVMKAKALDVHKTLTLAMNDVERQFREGMVPFALQKASGLTHDQVGALCTASIKYFREGFDRPWALATLEKELEHCMPKEEPVVISTKDTGSATLADDPLAFLLGLTLGACELPLEPSVRDFLASATATYLDPFIDGEVPAAEYHKRSEGLMMPRLRAAWAEHHRVRALETPDFPVAPVHALAQYIVHCIGKMNLNLGFGAHMPGVGRNPISMREDRAPDPNRTASALARPPVLLSSPLSPNSPKGSCVRPPPSQSEVHFKKLGEKLIEAVQRDFPAGERAFGSLPALTAAQIQHVGQIHLKSVALYQQEFGNALAVANLEGEEARREERMRI